MADQGLLQAVQGSCKFLDPLQVDCLYKITSPQQKNGPSHHQHETSVPVVPSSLTEGRIAPTKGQRNANPQLEGRGQTTIGELEEPRRMGERDLLYRMCATGPNVKWHHHDPPAPLCLIVCPSNPAHDLLVIELIEEDVGKIPDENE